MSWDIEALNRYMSFIAVDRSNASVTVVFVLAFIGERLHLYVKKEPSYVTDRIIMLVNIVQLALLNLDSQKKYIAYHYLMYMLPLHDQYSRFHSNHLFVIGSRH